MGSRKREGRGRERGGRGVVLPPVFVNASPLLRTERGAKEERAWQKEERKSKGGRKRKKRRKKGNAVKFLNATFIISSAPAAKH